MHTAPDIKATGVNQQLSPIAATFCLRGETSGHARFVVPSAMPVTVADYGTASGKPVIRYTLSNNNNVSIDVINYGGIVTAIRVPDRNGQVADITLGFDTLAEYEADTFYFGALVGRFANNISGGRFTLKDGSTHQLSINNGENHLHGGTVGFNKKLWGSEVGGDRVRMWYTSEDGEEGYPGQLKVTVIYHLTHLNQLELEYTATTTKATPVNLTSHCYFNLAGHDKRDVYDHMICLDCDTFTPKHDDGIPTGEIASVVGSVFDLRHPTRVGDCIHNVPGDTGFDHNFCAPDNSRNFIARVSEPSSGRVLELRSTLPGVQFYTSNFLDGVPGKGGATYRQHGALCLEAQYYPDSVNHSNFPNTILQPGVAYRASVSYTFSVLTS